MRILFLILFLFSTHNLWAQEEMFTPSPEPEIQLQEFISFSNFFKVLVPVEWEQYEDVLAADAEKVYGVDLKGPANKDGAFTSITVLYYGPDHALFQSSDEFIQANAKSLIVFDEVMPVQVSGRNASRIERRVMLNIPFKTESIPMHELLFVVPVEKGGFFVLEYSSPEDSYQKYIKAFDAVLATFEPRI